MAYIIKSTLIDLNAKEAKKIKQSSKNLGNYYSGDRFYTLLNEYIDNNLKRKNKLLAFIIRWLFKSGNYKHDPQIANGKSWGCILLDAFCVLCFIAFIALIIVTMGTSIIKAAIGDGSGGATSFIDKLGKVLGDMFSTAGDASGSGLYMIIAALICGVIGIAWMIMFFKIRKKNAALSLKDYVIKKLNTTLKWRWLIKLADKSAKTIKIKKSKELEVFCLNKFEGQGGAGDRWLNIQMINVLASIFDDLDLMFKFDSLTDDEYKELKEIMDYDFKRVDIIKI